MQILYCFPGNQEVYSGTESVRRRRDRNSLAFIHNRTCCRYRRSAAHCEKQRRECARRGARRPAFHLNPLSKSIYTIKGGLSPLFYLEDLCLLTDSQSAWNLAALSSGTEEGFSAELAEAQKCAQEFAGHYRGRIAELLSGRAAGSTQVVRETSGKAP